MSETYYLPDSMASRQVRITVVGVGGTGSAVLDGLAAMTTTLVRLGHPGFEVTVYDDDTVSEANIGRQRFCAADIGQPKAVVLCHRLNLFYGVKWTPVVQRFVPDDFRFGDLLITCVDKASVRATIGQAYRDGYGSRLWLDFGNGADRGQVILGNLCGECDGIRMPNVFDLHPELSGIDDDDEPSCSLEQAITRQSLFVGRALADHGLDLLMRLFRFGKLDRHGVHLDLASGQASAMPVDPIVWESFGYENKVPLDH